nr:MAG TPA: hypothetical protein [Caudoviricetes sp.]
MRRKRRLLRIKNKSFKIKNLHSKNRRKHLMN